MERSGKYHRADARSVDEACSYVIDSRNVFMRNIAKFLATLSDLGYQTVLPVPRLPKRSSTVENRDPGPGGRRPRTLGAGPAITLRMLASTSAPLGAIRRRVDGAMGKRQ